MLTFEILIFILSFRIAKASMSLVFALKKTNSQDHAPFGLNGLSEKKEKEKM